MNLGKEKKAEIFKKLAHKSTYETGMEFGFDKFCKDDRAIRNSVGRVYREVKASPQKYGLTTEAVDMVSEAMASRKISKGKSPVSKSEREQIKEEDIKGLTTSVRNKAFYLMDKKLDMLAKSKKKLDSISFSQLGTIAGIAFDKNRLLQGEATEHIVSYSRIKKDMDPDEAMNIIMEIREKTVQSKGE